MFLNKNGTVIPILITRDDGVVVVAKAVIAAAAVVVVVVVSPVAVAAVTGGELESATVSRVLPSGQYGNA